jgi:hypothetical protein
VLPDGKMVLAQVLGPVGATDVVQMCVGGRAFAMRGSDLVPGASRDELALITETLHHNRTHIWIRRVGKRLQTGIQDENRNLLTVAPIEVIGQEEEFVGVLCEGVLDRKLGWLPAREAAACRLTFRAAAAVYRASPLQSFQALRREDGTISILEHPRVRNELRRLSVGTPISVSLLPGLSDPFWPPTHFDTAWVPRLARSRETALVMAAAVSKGAPREDGGLSGEIALHGSGADGPRILVVPAGGRRAVPDFPLWLAGDDSGGFVRCCGGRIHHIDCVGEPGLTAGVLIDRYLQGRDAGPLDTAVLGTCVAQYRQETTVGLLAGIALAVLLDRSREAHATDAALITRHLQAMLDDIFGRAIRSSALEHLARWHKVSATRSATKFTFSRYQALMDVFKTRGALVKAQDIAENWLNGVAMEGVSDPEEALANALGAIVGVCRNLNIVAEFSISLSEVIAATRLISHVAGGRMARFSRAADD